MHFGAMADRMGREVPWPSCCRGVTRRDPPTVQSNRNLWWALGLVTLVETSVRVFLG